MGIMEQLIDAKLEQEYSTAQVEAFYKDFAADSKKYRDIDAPIVDTLFAFTNFQEFKKSMLKYKSALDKDKAEGSSAATPMRINSTLVDEAFCWKLIGENKNDPANGWSLRVTHSEEGVEFVNYTKMVEGFDLQWTFNKCTFKNIKIAAMHDMMTNIEKHQRDDNPNVKEFITIDRHPDGLIKTGYSRASLGMFMSDRDNLFSLTAREMPDGSKVYNTSSIEDPRYPEVDGVVRMMIFKHSVVTQVGDDLQFIDLANFNIGGYVPASLLNMVMGSMMKAGIAKFAEKLKKINDAL